jgi:hypothetical protein
MVKMQRLQTIPLILTWALSIVPIFNQNWEQSALDALHNHPEDLHDYMI